MWPEETIHLSSRKEGGGGGCNGEPMRIQILDSTAYIAE